MDASTAETKEVVLGLGKALNDGNYEAARRYVSDSMSYVGPFGKFSGVKAEVLFLAIATLGNQGPQFAQAYWREVVEATGAKLVVPVHWDDFIRPLSESFTPLPYAFDELVSLE